LLGLFVYSRESELAWCGRSESGRPVVRVGATAVAAAASNLLWQVVYLPLINDRHHAVSLSVDTTSATLAFALIIALPLDRFVRSVTTTIKSFGASAALQRCLVTRQLANL